MVNIRENVTWNLSLSLRSVPRAWERKTLLERRGEGEGHSSYIWMVVKWSQVRSRWEVSPMDSGNMVAVHLAIGV